MAVGMRQISNLYQVHQLTGSSIHLGLTGFFQALPFIAFGLFAGALADAFDRKKLMMLGQALNVLPGLTLGFLTITGWVQVWQIYVLGILTSSVQVFSWPARAALIPRLVPKTHLMSAITLNSLILQASFLFSPMIAGALIDLIGLDYTYFVDAALLGPALLSVLAIRSSGASEGAQARVSIAAIMEGLKFIWVERIILGLFILDFGVTLVGFYRPILPIFAKDIFGVGATGLGTLYAAPAVGAILGGMSLLMVGEVNRKGILVLVAAVLFGLGLGALGASPFFWVAVCSLGFLGVTDAISVAVRRTVVQLLAPDALMGRAASLITVFAQTTNALGALLAGAAAALVGAPNAMLAGSVLCFMLVGVIARAFPQIWRYRTS